MKTNLNETNKELTYMRCFKQRRPINNTNWANITEFLGDKMFVGPPTTSTTPEVIRKERKCPGTRSDDDEISTSLRICGLQCKQ